jgi:hypothetical protein
MTFKVAENFPALFYYESLCNSGENLHLNKISGSGNKVQEDRNEEPPEQIVKNNFVMRSLEAAVYYYYYYYYYVILHRTNSWGCRIKTSVV